MVVTLVLAALLLLLLALFVQFLMRENALDRVRVVGTTEWALSVSDPDFYETFQRLTSTTIYPGNRVELLLNGEVFGPLLEDLGKAESAISWHVYWLRAGHLADRVRDVLAERARAGVKVFFLLDPIGSDVDEAWIASLASAGVEVARFRDIRWSNAYKVQQRMHIRAVIVDGRVGYLGGFGIDDRWNGNGREPGQWRDTAVRIIGPAVDQLQAAFVTNWAETTAELLVGDALFHPADREVGSVRCGIMHTAPSLGSTNGERYYVLSVAAARSRLYITNPYFIPDADFRTLLAAAVARGVDVRILTPGRNNDQRSALWASRHHYEQLLASGVRIWEYRPTMIHAKTLVVDGIWFSVGTINFDNRSITLNDEVTLAGHDEELGRRLEQIFLDDLAWADEVDLDAFRRRGRSDRAKEWIYSRIEALL